MNKVDDKKIDFTKNPDTIVKLSIGDLNDLVYVASFHAATNACSNLYKGLTKAFLDRFDEDHAILIDEMEQIRVRLNALGNEESENASGNE